VKSIEDLLVKNNEITGWTYSGAGWVANNISELTNYIDGLADVFQRYGFNEASYQLYVGAINSAQVELRLTVYNLGTNENVKSLTADQAISLVGGIQWTNGAGEFAQYARYNGLSQELIFYRDKYYVNITIMADTEESLNIIKQFALNVDGKIKK